MLANGYVLNMGSEVCLWMHKSNKVKYGSKRDNFKSHDRYWKLPACTRCLQVIVKESQRHVANMQAKNVWFHNVMPASFDYDTYANYVLTPAYLQNLINQMLMKVDTKTTASHAKLWLRKPGIFGLGFVDFVVFVLKCAYKTCLHIRTHRARHLIFFSFSISWKSRILHPERILAWCIAVLYCGDKWWRGNFRHSLPSDWKIMSTALHRYIYRLATWVVAVAAVLNIQHQFGLTLHGNGCAIRCDCSCCCCCRWGWCVGWTLCVGERKKHVRRMYNSGTQMSVLQL